MGHARVCLKQGTGALQSAGETSLAAAWPVQEYRQRLSVKWKIVAVGMES